MSQCELARPEIDRAARNRTDAHVEAVGECGADVGNTNSSARASTGSGPGPNSWAAPPSDRISAATAQLLLASGTAEAYTTIGGPRGLSAHAPEPKLFWAVPGAAHVDLERFPGVDCWEHVLPFFELRLRRIS